MGEKQKRKDRKSDEVGGIDKAMSKLHGMIEAGMK